MKVVVGPLAQSGLEARVGRDLPAAVNTALIYYVGKLNSARRPAEFPKYLAMQGERPGGEGGVGDPEPSVTRPELEVEVDERIEAAIFTDAENQGVSPTDLAGHAVLVYLAELDLIGDREEADRSGVPSFGAPIRATRGTTRGPAN